MQIKMIMFVLMEIKRKKRIRKVRRRRRRRRRSESTRTQKAKKRRKERKRKKERNKHIWIIFFAPMNAQRLQHLLFLNLLPFFLGKPFLRTLKGWLFLFSLCHISPRSTQTVEPWLKGLWVIGKFFDITYSLKLTLPFLCRPSLILLAKGNPLLGKLDTNREYRNRQQNQKRYEIEHATVYQAACTQVTERLQKAFSPHTNNLIALPM